MNEELEKKWREEFESHLNDNTGWVLKQDFDKKDDGKYLSPSVQTLWETYFAARKKAQEEMFLFIESLVMTDMGKASDMLMEKYEQLQRERDND